MSILKGVEIFFLRLWYRVKFERGYNYTIISFYTKEQVYKVFKLVFEEDGWQEASEIRWGYKGYYMWIRRHKSYVKQIIFTNGLYKTTNLDEIEALTNHPYCKK